MMPFVFSACLVVEKRDRQNIICIHGCNKEFEMPKISGKTMTRGANEFERLDSTDCALQTISKMTKIVVNEEKKHTDSEITTRMVLERILALETNNIIHTQVKQKQQSQVQRENRPVRLSLPTRITSNMENEIRSALYLLARTINIENGYSKKNLFVALILSPTIHHESQNLHSVSIVKT